MSEGRIKNAGKFMERDVYMSVGPPTKASKVFINASLVCQQLCPDRYLKTWKCEDGCHYV
jgi:hypothetical protein